MELGANKTSRPSNISSRKMFHYWRKYLTLQHCEWTCFVKFLFRFISAAEIFSRFSVLCISPLSLLEWLIDYADRLYAIVVQWKLIFAQPSDLQTAKAKTSPTFRLHTNGSLDESVFRGLWLWPKQIKVETQATFTGLSQADCVYRWI